MSYDKMLEDGLGTPAITIQARQLLGTVCVSGGADCPLINAQETAEVLDQVRTDPTVTIKLASNVEEIPHYAELDADFPDRIDADEVLNRKRDLDVLQKLGLVPGSVRRARYLYMLLVERIATPYGICAHDTRGWEGCPLATSGAYESVRAKGWDAVVYLRSDEEMQEYRRHSAERVANDERICIRSHHLMCMCCWYAGGEGQGLRPNDTLAELLQRIRGEPDVPITLVEGCCEACYCCDGFHPPTGRCVHAGGLIRDYKKDLDVLQKLGLMPGATMGARALLDLIFERIPSTRDICGYGDGVVTSQEWSVCGGPEGNAGYERTREIGVF